MSKTAITIFLCTGKDCTKAWHRVCHGSPGKWLKHQAEAEGLPYKLKIIKTECMDRCEQAACLCCVRDQHACFETGIHSLHDCHRLLAALRGCAENGELALCAGAPGGVAAMPARRS